MGALHLGGTRVARRASGGRLRGSVVILAIASIVAACGDTTPTPPPSAAPSQPAPATTPRLDDPRRLADATPARAPPPRPRPTPPGPRSSSPTRPPSPPSSRPAPAPVASRRRPSSGSPASTAPRPTPWPPACGSSRPSSSRSPRPTAPSPSSGPRRLSVPGPCTGSPSSAPTARSRRPGRHRPPARSTSSSPSRATPRRSVPLDAGIELIFDQAGVSTADLRDHLRIQPATDRPAPGRRAVRGLRPLEAAAPRHALHRDRDPRPADRRHGPAARGGRHHPVRDGRPRDEPRGRRPAAIVRRGHAPRARGDVDLVGQRERRPRRPPASPSPSIASAACRRPRPRGAPSARRRRGPAPTRDPPVPTTGLPEVIDARVPVRGGDEGRWFLLPRPLAHGLVPRHRLVGRHPPPGRPPGHRPRGLRARHHDPLDGLGQRPAHGRARRPARPSTSSGARSASPTPRASSSGRRPTRPGDLDTGSLPGRILLEVRDAGRTAFQPIATNDRLCDYCECGASGNDELWQVITSDRYRYRSTDTVNAWGVVRNRDTGAVPASLRVSLLVGEDGDDEPAPDQHHHGHPGRHRRVRGRDPAPGPARRQLPAARSRPVASTSASCGSRSARSRSPPTTWRSARTTARSRAASPSRSPCTARSSRARRSPGRRSTSRPTRAAGPRSSTDADGDATGSVRLDMSDNEQWTVQSIQATPTLPEEAELGASTPVAVFRGNSLVDVAGTVAGGNLKVTGTVTQVAFDRFDTAAGEELWSIDPHGAPRPGVDVRLQVHEHWTVRRQVGSRYDFVLKRVEPIYRTRDLSRVIDVAQVTTGPDGTFRYDHPIRAGRSYEITATYSEPGADLVADAWADGVAVADELRPPAPRRARPARRRAHLRDRRPDPPPVHRRHRQAARRALPVRRPPARAAVRRPPGVADLPLDLHDGRHPRRRGPRRPVHRLRLRGDLRPQRVVPHRGPAPRRPGHRGSLALRAGRHRHGDDPHARSVGPAGRPRASSCRPSTRSCSRPATPRWSTPSTRSTRASAAASLATIRSHQTPADDAYGEGGDTTGGGGDDGARGDFRDWLVGRLVRTSAARPRDDPGAAVRRPHVVARQRRGRRRVAPRRLRRARCSRSGSRSSSRPRSRRRSSSRTSPRSGSVPSAATSTPATPCRSRSGRRRSAWRRSPCPGPRSRRSRCRSAP